VRGEDEDAAMDMALRVVKNGSAMRQIISEEKRRQIIGAL
jgi:hypothetical protein